MEHLGFDTLTRAQPGDTIARALIYPEYDAAMSEWPRLERAAAALLDGRDLAMVDPGGDADLLIVETCECEHCHLAHPVTETNPLTEDVTLCLDCARRYTDAVVALLGRIHDTIPAPGEVA